jgi:hypothetical protein
MSPARSLKAPTCSCHTALRSPDLYRPCPHTCTPTAPQVLALLLDLAIESRQLPRAVAALQRLERLHSPLCEAYAERAGEGALWQEDPPHQLAGGSAAPAAACCQTPRVRERAASVALRVEGRGRVVRCPVGGACECTLPSWDGRCGRRKAPSTGAAARQPLGRPRRGRRPRAAGQAGV